MKMRNLGIFSLLVLFIFSACRKDTLITETTIDTPPPDITSYEPAVESITAGVIGFVVDEANVPVKNAIVVLDNIMTTTDNYGHFFIENETMNALGTLVKVEKDGYFEGSRRFFPIEGERSRVKIQLLDKSFDNSFSAASGGNVNLSNGAALEFAPNSIQAADGSAYTGTVNVAMKWLDPSSNATFDQMPGNLQGINGEIEQVALSTFGMIAVELQGEAGETLNIADGSTAEITMPVPASMLSGAPNEIPLWSYHEDLGLWVQESTATLQGDKYVGVVTHFSFWNCDIPHNYANIEMAFVDDNEIPLNNYLVTLTVVNASNVNFWPSGSGYTDENGNVSGIIPADVALLLQVFDACGAVLFSQIIGPFNTGTDLGIITVTGTGANSTTITGNLIDCNGAPVTNGIVIVEFQGQTIYHYITTANFSMTFSTCTSTTDIGVMGVNLDEAEQSVVLDATAATTTDLGNINVCDIQLENYISITIDGVNAVFLNAYVDVDSDTTYVRAVNNPPDPYYAWFYFPGITPGNYQSNAGFQAIFHDTLGWNFPWHEYDTFEITQYDSLIIGSFTGQVGQNFGNDPLPITCTFSINN